MSSVLPKCRGLGLLLLLLLGFLPLDLRVPAIILPTSTKKAALQAALLGLLRGTEAQKLIRRPKRNCRSSIPSRARFVTLFITMKSEPSETDVFPSSGVAKCGVLLKLNDSMRN